MQLFTTTRTLETALDSLRNEHTIGFVPTMGALHKGHLSLVQNAKKNVDIVVVSIFVNPTQFDNTKDLTNYPNTLQSDLYVLEMDGCDVVFVPNVSEIYDGVVLSESFDFDGLENVMEGAHRQGHFDGVGTIVKRLFEIVKPNVAFFGEKDFQQLQIIRKLVRKEGFDIEIIGNPIFREEDGLAMSSRNTRLLPEYREAAPFIYQTMLKAKQLFGTENARDVSEWVQNSFDNHPILKLEYFTIANESNLLPMQQKIPKTKYRAFIAVFAGEIRLIDTVAFY